MMEFSCSLSRRVFDDGICAYDNPSHPCHPFVRWQQSYAKEKGRPELTFQLPEPFSGERSSLNLVFVGLNPSFDPWEEFPTPTDSFEYYDAFFRRRYDDEHRNDHGQPVIFRVSRRNKRTRRSPKFWRGIEWFGGRYLAGPLGGGFRLGADAIVTQVVRYKSRRGWVGDRDNSPEGNAIWQHEDDLTTKIMDGLQPDVAVPCGEEAVHGLARALNLSHLEEVGIGQAVGGTYPAELPCGKEMRICPSKHQSRYWLTGSDEWQRTANAIIKALELSR
jgi:hypothetical protein